MTNNAWSRLCAEWNANRYNDEFRALCRRTEMDPDSISAMEIENMKWIRSTCKKEYVWLEDQAESNIYIAIMPFGGHTRDSLKVLKNEIKKYRESGKINSVYKQIIADWEER